MGDLGFEDEGDEIFGFFALDDEFTAFVGDDIDLVAFEGEVGVVDVVGFPELGEAVGF